MQQSAMGNNLNYLIKPSTNSVYDDGTIENTPTLQFAYGAASMQGWRKKQEDKFTCLAKLCKNFSFFGIYDGHGGSEIAEYLQENLHLELKHFLETEEDVEMALYLGFLSADSTLKVPEIIAELNSKLDLECSDISIEKRKKLFHHAKLLEKLKKTGVNAEAQAADDPTQPNGTSLSQKQNVSISTKESNDNVTQGPSGSTQDSTSGPTQDSSDGRPIKDSSDGGPIKDSSAGEPIQDSSSGGPIQDSSAGGPIQGSSAGGPAPDASAGGPTPDASAGGPTPDASAGGPAPGASAGGPAPGASAGGPTPDASAGGSPQDPSAGGSPQDPSAGEPVPDSSAGGPTPESGCGPTPDSSAGRLTCVSSAGGPPQDPGSTRPTQVSCSAESTRDSGAAGSAESLSVAHSTHDSNITKSSDEMDTAGPSQECDSSTEEEEVEMEDESIEEETIDTLGEEGKEMEQPLEYLLNQELESTDPEDEDFSYDEETESEGSDDGVKTTPMGFKLTADEFVHMQPGDLSGSTATVVLLTESTIHVANVGDSRCVLSRKGEAVDMSVDHKPTDAEEEERIVLNGGIVRMGRINESIDMSRAFGDFKLKGSSLIPSEQCVTAEPTIKSIPIDMDDEFLVIASDGIWNAMTSQEVVDYIHMRLRHENCDLRDICNELFQMILSPDLENDGTGCDNMSCIIIKFIQRGVRFPERRICGPLGFGGRLTLGINKDQNITMLYNSPF